jgi:hypothetical protein
LIAGAVGFAIAYMTLTSSGSQRDQMDQLLHHPVSKQRRKPKASPAEFSPPVLRRGDGWAGA